MNNLHPAWQSEDEEVPVHIVSKQQNTPAKEISRRPAAIVGMLLVVGAGFLFFLDIESPTGQLVDLPVSGPSIRITDTGFMPSTLDVRHGETITWVSETDFPLTVTSDVLCSDNNFCLQTDPLTTGNQQSFTITQGMASGPYTYYTKETGMQGQIIVREEQEVVVSPSEPIADLPQNPFAIGNNTAPVSQPPVAQVIAETGGPIYQPQTGPEVWLVLLGSLAGLLYVSRGMLTLR